MKVDLELPYQCKTLRPVKMFGEFQRISRVKTRGGSSIKHITWNLFYALDEKNFKAMTLLYIRGLFTITKQAVIWCEGFVLDRKLSTKTLAEFDISEGKI